MEIHALDGVIALFLDFYIVRVRTLTHARSVTFLVGFESNTRCPFFYKYLYLRKVDWTLLVL